MTTENIMDNFSTENELNLALRTESVLKLGYLSVRGSRCRIERDEATGKLRITAPRDKVLVGSGWREKSHLFDHIGWGRNGQGEGLFGVYTDVLRDEEKAFEARVQEASKYPPFSISGNVFERAHLITHSVLIHGVVCGLMPTYTSAASKNGTGPYTLVAPEHLLFKHRKARSLCVDFLDYRVTGDGKISLNDISFIDAAAYEQRKDVVTVTYVNGKRVDTPQVTVKAEQPVVQPAPQKAAPRVSKPAAEIVVGKPKRPALPVPVQTVIDKMHTTGAKICPISGGGFSGDYLVTYNKNGHINNASRVPNSTFTSLIEGNLIAEDDDGNYRLTADGIAQVMTA